MSDSPLTPGMQGPTIPGDYQYQANFQGPPIQRCFHHQRRILLDALAPVGPDDVVLDAGCGSGVFASHVAQRGARVIGIDANPGSIGFARAAFGGPRAEFHTRPLHETGLDGSSVNLILLFEVIEHLEHDYLEKVAQEFRRILLPGGALLVTAPNYRSAWPLVEIALDRWELVPALAEQHITRTNVPYLRKCELSRTLALEKVGTFNFLAPALAPLSWRLAERIGRWETYLARGRVPGGVQVFGLWRKPRTT